MSVTKEEFEAWRQHPVTRLVNKYLSDLAQWQRSRWAEGQDWTDESRIAVQFLDQLSELDLESIETFYEGYDEE